ncbi:MAG: hypothetical protein RSD40_05865, partial [Bacilli bacterium]
DYSNIAETFLFPLKKLINEILTIDIDKTNTELKDYIEILYNHANTSIDSDHVARLPLFNASTYNYSSNIELQDLIFAVNKIIDTKIYKETIEKYIPNLTNLKNLYIDLVSKWEKEKKEEKAKKVVDDMITVLKGALSPKSKVTATKDIDLVKIYKEKKIIKKFDNLINSLKMEMELPNLKQSFKGYNILVSKGVFNSASEIIGSFTLPKVGIKDDFDKYYESEPSRYLQGIYEKGIPEPMLHRLLIKMPIEATDSTNTPVSGGQKAEIILLKKIENAKKYDILLIDEPESSFDNEFIMNKTTVFISTHNNTLGVSIKSDKIIYTAKTGKNEYDIFTGTNQSSKLSSVSGKELKSYETILGTMEAGSIAYKGSKEIYENLGDKK